MARLVRCIQCSNVFEAKGCRAVCSNCKYRHGCGEVEEVDTGGNKQKMVQIPGGGFVSASKRGRG